MAFEGPGKFFAGKDASLDHDERLRLHETVLVRRLRPLRARSHERRGPLNTPYLRDIE
jgi:hypothetical protein